MSGDQPSQKSPYIRGNSSRRGRSWMLVTTVVILLVAVAAWIVSYTGAVATAPQKAGQTIDPGATSPASR